MAILNKGQTFSDGEQVTSAKLNTAVDGATFASGAVDDVSTQLSGGAIIVKDGGVTLQKLATAVKDALYPIGSIYTNATNSTNPATLIGFGTWVAFGAGKVIVGIDSGDADFDTAEETGGSKDAVIVNHNHSITQRGIQGNSYDTLEAISFDIGGTEGTVNTSNAGESGIGKNLQPYIVVYMWKRTA